MSTPAQAREPGRARKYLYAVVAGIPHQDLGALGIDHAKVYSIGKGRLAAMVSDLPCDHIRPERRHLAAHQQVLRRLMEMTTPLPISFGTLAGSAGAVRKILADHEQTFLAALARVAGKVEMGVRVTWDVPNIFEYFVNTHADLRIVRDQLFQGGRVPTQEEKIEVGRLFDRVRQQDREDFAAQVENVLAPCCSDIKQNKVHDEREVMSLACLIGKQAQAQFEAAVLEAARLFDNNFAFDYNGPWAPYNFVQTVLEQ